MTTNSFHTGTKLSLARLLLLLFFLLVGWFTVDASTAIAQQPSPTYDPNMVTAPQTPPIASSGHASFQENCSPCHGASGMGDGPTAKDLPSPPTKFADPNAIFEKSPAQLFHTAKFGRLEKLMPPWQNKLNDDQIWQTIAYAWSLHTDATYVNEGRDLYTVGCASCHGEGGAGGGSDATASKINFSDPAYAIMRSQSDWLQGWQTAHPDVGAEWSVDDQRKVLEYLRSFSYIPPWESPYRPGEGVLLGQVMQRTADGPAVAGLDVALEAYVDFQRVAFFTTTVDTEGNFRFETLATDPGIVYMASVSAEGINYSSPILKLEPTVSTITTTVSVYGQTEDASGILIDRAHWILDSQPGALVVGEVYEFSNSSDRTFIGSRVEGIDQPVTVALAVPPGAQEINFENGALGDRFQQQGNLIYDTTPVVPGKAARQIIMRYVLPTTGALDLEQEFRYPIGDLTVLVSELPGVTAEVTGLSAMGSQNMQGSSYQLWQGQALMPGKIALKLAGLLTQDSIDPRTVQGADGSASAPPMASGSVLHLESWMTWAMGGFLLLPLAGALVWAMRSGTMQRKGQVTDFRMRRTELLKQIARLDDLHALDQIDTAAWQQQRSLLKAELLEINAKVTNSAAVDAGS